MVTKRLSDEPFEAAPEPAPPSPTPAGQGVARISHLLGSAQPPAPQGVPPSHPARVSRRAPVPRPPQHMPRTLAQVLEEANDSVVRGDLSDFMPQPTGFDPLDSLIGGGLRRTELVLLGGAQGIGKTIAALQMARNIAMRPDQFAFYISYEHTETHLMNRLLCLESVNPPEIDTRNGLKLKDLFDIIISQRARAAGTRQQQSRLAADHPARKSEDFYGASAPEPICRPLDRDQSEPSGHHAERHSRDDGAPC
ncbi:MAG: AAA family ATPase [Chloroflexi bacterium]|nr:AAA family ATPase [Chloroflexota bacterium]